MNAILRILKWIYRRFEAVVRTIRRMIARSKRHEHVLAAWPDSNKQSVRYEASDLGAVGLMHCTFFVLGVDIDGVQRMLPANLTTGEQPLMSDGRYPIFIMCASQKGVRSNVFDRGGMKYGEFIISIPGIRWKNREEKYLGPFIYMPRLFLNRPLPILLGWIYGFPKLPARVSDEPGQYSVKKLVYGDPLISLRYRDDGPEVDPRDTPHFIPVGSLFRQPFVAHNAIGAYECSVFDFMIDRSTLQPVDATLEIHRSFVPGLPTGLFRSGSITEEACGAFRMTMPWALSTPIGPDELDVPADLPEVVVPSRAGRPAGVNL